MNLIVFARKLADYLNKLPDFVISKHNGYDKESMGAIIADAVLQAGLNYRTVVAPRVKRILNDYPDAATTLGFLETIDRFGCDVILRWNHPEKPRRVQSLALLLENEQVETKDQLRDWLKNDVNSEKLRAIPGIGPKTIDYLKNLSGLSAIAIDRHIRRLAFEAGIIITDYRTLRKVVEFTADLLDVPQNDLDHSIWLYMSKPSRSYCKKTSEYSEQPAFSRERNGKACLI